MPATLKCVQCGRRLLGPDWVGDRLAICPGCQCVLGTVGEGEEASRLKSLTLPELVARLRAMGVALWLEDGWVRTRAPRGVLTADLRRVLARRKGELAELLAAEALAQKAALAAEEGQEADRPPAGPT